MKELSRFFSSIENTEINRRSNAIILHIRLNQSSKFCVRAIVAHVASQSAITYDFHLSNQDCKAE